MLDIPRNEAANIVLDYALYKKGQTAGSHLSKLLQTLHVLSISSSACGRGFSQHNLHQTSLRNKLSISRVNSGAGSYLAGMTVAIPIQENDGWRHTNNF
jgi:hypothetical protein